MTSEGRASATRGQAQCREGHTKLLPIITTVRGKNLIHTEKKPWLHMHQVRLHHPTVNDKVDILTLLVRWSTNLEVFHLIPEYLHGNL